VTFGGNPVRTLGGAAELPAPGGIVIAEIDLASVESGHELSPERNTIGQWFP
jgi:hypothetical protein